MAYKVIIADKVWRDVYESLDEYYPPDIPRNIVEKFINRVQYLESMNDWRDVYHLP